MHVPLVQFVVAYGAALMLGTSSAGADTIQLLRPTDDSFVTSQEGTTDHNYDGDPRLVVWANYPSYGSRAYLEFDLSSIPAGEVVTFARLNLLQYDGGGYSSGLDVFRVASDAWSEGTLTWDNQPVLIPDALDLIAVDPALTGSERRWISVDLLANGGWDPSVDLAQGDGRISMILRIPGGETATQRAHVFCSSAAGSFDCLLPGESGPTLGRAPQLVIGTPEPALGGMLAAGTMALLVAARHRRKRSIGCSSR